MINSLDSSIPEKNDKVFRLATIITVIIIFGFWLIAYFTLKDKSSVDRGTFGDMFGAVNALFSGLALAGIILTILLQRKELSLQREELQYTREELKRSADAQEKSEIALNSQAENLKISAKLTALNTLVNYYTDQERVYNEIQRSHPLGRNIKKKKEEYLKRIENILEASEKSAPLDL